MIADSEKGLFDVVLVWKLDRFSRDRYDSAHYKHILKKNGVRVISARENISEGPEGIILESMLEGYAEYYSAELSEKIQRGQKENALKCRSNGGNVPLGYKIGSDGVLEIDPATAPLVEEIFTRYESGETIKAIADSLNERGLRTRKTGHSVWHRSASPLKTESTSVNINTPTPLFQTEFLLLSIQICSSVCRNGC